jgi:hypothetical protein
MKVVTRETASRVLTPQWCVSIVTEFHAISHTGAARVIQLSSVCIYVLFTYLWKPKTMAPLPRDLS